MSSPELARKTCAYFAPMGHVRDPKPVKVTITYRGKDEVWYGMKWGRVWVVTETTVAHTRDKVPVGTEKLSPAIELIGFVPRSYAKKVRDCGYWCQKFLYHHPDSGVWYVSHYLPANSNLNVEFHPFGHTCGLGLWVGEIGEGRVLVPMKIEEV